MVYANLTASRSCGMADIRVSVLMPIHRPHEEWFLLAIRSLLNQTYTSWQLVLSLDGNDEQTSHAARLASELVNNLVIVKGEHTGIVGALNRGLCLCNTEFTARMDSDDLALPKRLELQVLKLDSDPKIAALGTQIIPVDRLGRPIPELPYKYPCSSIKSLVTGALVNNPIPHPTLIFRTNLVKQVGGYREKRCMEDYDLISRLSTYGSVQNLPTTCLHYRCHTNQLTKLARPIRAHLLQARVSFLKNLLMIRPWLIILSPIPFALFLLGPQNELLARKLAKVIIAKYRKFTGS